MIQLIIGIFCFLFISAFLEMVEMACVFSDKVELEKERERGSRRAGFVLSFVKRPERLFTITLIGSDIAIVISSFYLERIMSSLLPISIAIPVATVIMTVLVVMLGQILPKGFGMRYSIPVAINTSYFVKVLSYILFPVIFISETISKQIVRLAIRREPKNIYIKREEMKVLINARTFSGLDEKTRLIINNIFDLSEFDLKVNLKYIIEQNTMEISKTVGDMFDKLMTKPSDKLIITDEKGRPIGIIYTKDLLKVESIDEPISHLVRVPPVIKESTTMEDALKLIKGSGLDCAFVLNKSGDIIGFIDITDIYRIVFGEIPDEVESRIFA
jgi:putative hemolysin